MTTLGSRSPCGCIAGNDAPTPGQSTAPGTAGTAGEKSVLARSTETSISKSSSPPPKFTRQHPEKMARCGPSEENVCYTTVVPSTQSPCWSYAYTFCSVMLSDSGKYVTFAVSPTTVNAGVFAPNSAT